MNDQPMTLSRLLQMFGGAAPHAGTTQPLNGYDVFGMGGPDTSGGMRAMKPQMGQAPPMSMGAAGMNPGLTPRPSWMQPQQAQPQQPEMIHTPMQGIR